MTNRRKEDKGIEAKRLLGGLDLKTIIVIGMLGGSGSGTYFGLSTLLGHDQKNSIEEMVKNGMIETPEDKGKRTREIIEREIKPYLMSMKEDIEEIKDDIKEIRRNQ